MLLKGCNKGTENITAAKMDPLRSLLGSCLYRFIIVRINISVLFAQQYGSRDLAGFRQEGFLASVFGGLFTLVLSLAALLLLRPLLTLMQTPEDVARLLEGCAANADEVVVDLGSACDGRTRKILELADQVWLVGDGSMVCRAKCHQFRTQHDVYGEIAPKLTVVANRGARNVALPEERELSLPKVHADDPAAVYRALAESIQ